MTSAEKKSHLRSYINIRAECMEQLERIEEWRSFAERCTTAITGMPGGGKASSRVETAAVAIADICENMCEKLQEMAQKRAEIETSIEIVPDPQCRRLLQLVYIDGLSWEKAAEHMNYSVRAIYYLHGKALGQYKGLQ